MLHGGFGKNGVKGRDERKVRALDTALPKQTLHYALFSAKDLKKSLDNADTVIHGAPIHLGVVRGEPPAGITVSSA